ncbi:hypothetical protein Aph02nite_78300 [Actinoplanes philippinensis]|uniref:Uncharacterized protein n=1 Tax=Actinoplanes philippinensis TaxID=35752 RepID=A0A1I2KBA4_9ACTN|nr:hypothetical protein [Actinoplanes philippinensis]GIE81880.1 hypothetical protein Aph02nite_78300 [Actinoplanes philippinensis]SFF64325.1 hypothetical protein SAMN05421541_11659 [Actinoplanes philippinensis]
MMRRCGDRATFAIEVGDFVDPPWLRTVDVWAAGTWVTTDDNTAYVPAFGHAVRSEAVRVRRGDVRSHPFPDRSPEETFRLLDADETGLADDFRCLDWGPTVDNVSARAYRDDDGLVLTFAFWRADHPSPEDLGRVFVVRIPPDDYAGVLEQAADLLSPR